MATVIRMAPIASKIPLESLDLDRFWAKVDKSGDCWLWTGATSGSRGVATYGQVSIAGRRFLAHRVSMALHLGDLAIDAVVDHDSPGVGCRNRLCVKPAHLVVTDVRGNNATKEGGKYVAALGVECQRGHSLATPESRYFTKGGLGCRECKRLKQREAYHRRTVDPDWRARKAAYQRARRTARKSAS